MPCTSVTPELGPVERARYVTDNLPPGLFRLPDDADTNVAWRVSPEPFPLLAQDGAAIESLGNDLLAFTKALNALYLRSARGTAPAYIAEELDRGKPEQIVKLARQNRFKQDIPRVIRPDLILTDDGYVASELDSVRAGWASPVRSRARTARSAPTASAGRTASRGASRGDASLASVPRPTVAVVVSQESADYRPEMTWLASRINALDVAEAIVCGPQDIVFTEEALFVRRADGREAKIDVLYRNFELFDLLNVPKQELVMYAARHNRVQHHAAAEGAPRGEVGVRAVPPSGSASVLAREFGRARRRTAARIFPYVDRRPAAAAVARSRRRSARRRKAGARLVAARRARQERARLRAQAVGVQRARMGLARREGRDDLTREEWRAALAEAQRSFPKTPYILQRFHKGKRVRVPFLSTSSGEIKEMDGRVRLCPYSSSSATRRSSAGCSRRWRPPTSA